MWFPPSPPNTAVPAGLEVHNSSSRKPVNHSAAALVANKRFTCTECGKCCTGNGEVYVSIAECSAIASHLQVPLDHFLETYCKQSTNPLDGCQLKSKDTLDKVGSASATVITWDLFQAGNQLRHCNSSDFTCSCNLQAFEAICCTDMRDKQLLFCRLVYSWKTSFAQSTQ